MNNTQTRAEQIIGLTDRIQDWIGDSRPEESMAASGLEALLFALVNDQSIQYDLTKLVEQDRRDDERRTSDVVARENDRS